MEGLYGNNRTSGLVDLDSHVCVCVCVCARACAGRYGYAAALLSINTTSGDVLHLNSTDATENGGNSTWCVRCVRSCGACGSAVVCGRAVVRSCGRATCLVHYLPRFCVLWL